MDELLAEPPITVTGGVAVYHDVYTGEPTTHRFSFPGILVMGDKCPATKRTVGYGAFRNASVALRWLADIGAKTFGADQVAAIVSWTNSFMGRTVVVAPPRETLALFGGPNSFAQYHASYPFSHEMAPLKASDDLAQRIKKKEEKAVQRKAIIDEVTPKTFNLHRYVRANAHPGEWTHFEIDCVPGLDTWVVNQTTNCGWEGTTTLEKDLGIQLPHADNPKSSALFLQPAVGSLTKTQRALVRKIAAAATPLVTEKKKRSSSGGSGGKRKKAKKAADSMEVA